VGIALLHLLKLKDNVSVGVVGRSVKVDAAKEAGATFVIDKGTHDLWEKSEELSPEGYDIILDANGASTLKGSYRHLRPAGRLLIYGFASMFSHSGRKNTLKLLWGYLKTPRFNPFDLTGANKTISGFNLIYLFDRVDLFRNIMETLLMWGREGRLPLAPITTFAFEDVVSAHKAIESGRSIGKVVLVV
jgi:NADPH:quinone reductase-like Zn-dependent oxidoreductase